jgi:SAM-dependent methyltransferase
LMIHGSRKMAPNEKCLPETDKIGKEFDEDACDFCDRYKKRGLSGSSRLLLDFIREEGLEGRSVADLGCGAGGFSIELLKEGAQTAVGVDLSPKMVDSATNMAIANGLSDKAKFQVGNAAAAELPASDIVIMDKVLCCYSDWQPLLKNAVGASKSMVGFIVPRDEGVAKIPFRIGVRIVNYFQRRRGSLLFYLHPLKLVDRTLRDSGFTDRKKQGSRFWLVFLYSRPESNHPVRSR